MIFVPKLDGRNVLLFHVEHWDRGDWEYRFRVDGRDRSEVLSGGSGNSVMFAPDGGRSGGLEVQWREVGGEWRHACGCEFGPSQAMFRFRAKEEWDGKADWVDVCAMVDGMVSVWRLRPEQRRWRAGEEGTVHGKGVSIGLGQLLRGAGEFRYEDDRFEVENTGKSQVTLRPLDPVAGLSAMEFDGIWAVRTGRIGRREVGLLEKEVV